MLVFHDLGGFMKKINKKIIVCIMIILLILMPIFYLVIENPDVKAILLGIISSVIASCLFYVFSEVVFENKLEEINVLNQMIHVLERVQTKGMLDIRERSEFESEFWINFAENTDKEWVLSGRTLNRWLNDNIRESFKKNIIKILKRKGNVTFVIYKNLKGEEEREKEELRDFVYKEIFPKFTKKEGILGKKKKININLKILEVDELAYLYNSNDNEIIVAPYFAHNNNNDNLMFVLKKSCRCGEAYVNDFSYIIKHANNVQWEKEYLMSINGGK